MSWTGGLFEFTGDTKKEVMEAEIYERLCENRGFYEPRPQPLILLENQGVFPSYEAAEQKLSDLYSTYGRVRDYGVRFVEAKPTKKQAELLKRLKDMQDKTNRYAQEHSIQALTSEYAGCKKCGSKLKRSLLTGQRCPLCRNDLRSATTISTLQGYEKKMKEIQKEIQKEKEKEAKKNGKICWLVQADLYLG